MNAYVKAWQCIGCGKIETPQTCIGVCQDHKVEFVYAFEHEETLAQLNLARRQVDALGSIVRRLAWTKPHNAEWEHSYRALQEQARRILAFIGSGVPDPGGRTATDGRTTAAKALAPQILAVTARET